MIAIRDTDLGAVSTLPTSLSTQTMKRLRQIPIISTKLKSASSKIIKLLHIFIFGNEGDKNNRRRLSEFDGFKFSGESDELAVKMRQMSQQFSVGALVSICNVLAVDYTGTKQELISRICSRLKSASV